MYYIVHACMILYMYITHYKTLGKFTIVALIRYFVTKKDDSTFNRVGKALIGGLCF